MLKNKWMAIKALPRHNVFTTVCTLVALFAVTMFLFGFVVTKQVTVVDDGQTMQATSSRIYVDEFLTEQGITLRPGDRISSPLNSFLRHNSTITIERATKIVLTSDGETREVYGHGDILSAFLKSCDITLDVYDEITPCLETPVTEGMSVQICRVKVYEETVHEAAVCKTIIRPNYNEGKNHSVVLQEGKDGTQNTSYKVITRDGEEISREVLHVEPIIPSVDHIVEKGVQGNKVVAASASELKVKQIIDVKATAYSFNVGSVTASGRPAAYGVIAVDPRVIPLGSKLYIEAVDGSWTYGYAIAGDTGGAIRGNRIDLFYNTTAECFQFGRRPARVYVLE